MPSSEPSEWLEHLRRHQNPDGGFAYFAGRKSSLEPTALAALALSKAGKPFAGDPLRKARQYLLGRQSPSGHWPVSGDDRTPAWESSLVLLSLVGDPTLEAACRVGISAFLNIEAQAANTQATTLNPQWRGWNWYPPTPGWVEPTSLGLMAVRRLARLADSGRVAARLEDGRQYLLDRMAPDGGWNYGNSYVLGQALPSFLPPSAMALMALQPTDGASKPLERSLQRLETGLQTARSGLALSWGILALAAYGRPVERSNAELTSIWQRSRFLENSAVISLACLAAVATPADHPFLPGEVETGVR